MFNTDSGLTKSPEQTSNKKEVGADRYTHTIALLINRKVSEIVKSYINKHFPLPDNPHQTIIEKVIEEGEKQNIKGYEYIVSLLKEIHEDDADFINKYIQSPDIIELIKNIKILSGGVLFSTGVLIIDKEPNYFRHDNGDWVNRGSSWQILDKYPKGEFEKCIINKEEIEDILSTLPGKGRKEKSLLLKKLLWFGKYYITDISETGCQYMEFDDEKGIIFGKGGLDYIGKIKRKVNVSKKFDGKYSFNFLDEVGLY